MISVPIAAILRDRRRLIVVALIALHLAVALPLAYHLPIWADEGSTLYATEHGFINAFYTAAAEQKQAPLYFWVLSIWRYIDGSIFFARLFSVISSAVAIWVFAGLAERLFSRRTALLTTGFFALHPFLFWASLEIRVYSVVILLSIILIRLFIDAFLDKSASWGGRILFLVAAVVSLYTNYYLGFLLAGFFVSLLVAGRTREAVRLLVLMLIAGAALLPLGLELRNEFLTKAGAYREDGLFVESLRILWHHFLTFTLPTAIFPDSEPSTLSFVRLWVVRAACLVLAVTTFFQSRRLTRDTGVWTAIVVTIGGMLFLASFFVGTDYIALRHASVIFVPLIVWLTYLISEVTAGANEHVLRAGMAIACLVALGSFAYSTVTLYPNATKRGDWARVGEFIEKNESPGQPIIVFAPFYALSLPYHYHGVNRILPDRRFFDFQPYLAAPGTPESLAPETDFVISEIPPDAEFIWLSLNERCVTSAACAPLQNHIAANYTIEIEKEFYLAKVYLLRRKR